MQTTICCSIFLLLAFSIQGQEVTPEKTLPDRIKILLSKENSELEAILQRLKQTASHAKSAMPSDTPHIKEKQENLDKLYNMATSTSDVEDVDAILEFLTSFKSNLQEILTTIKSMSEDASKEYKNQLLKAIDEIQESIPLVEKLIKLCQDSIAGLSIPDACWQCWDEN